MKMFLCTLMLLPVVLVAQPPEWVGGSFKNTKAMLGLIEQRLSIKFTDSSISPNRMRMAFNDSSARFVVKVELEKDKVQTVNFETPTQQLKYFVAWYEKEFLEYALSKTENEIVFPSYSVFIKIVNNQKSSMHISAKMPAKK